MTTPNDRKTVQVSLPVHTRLHELATVMDTTADGVLRYFLDKSAVHMALSDRQRQRWEHAARTSGASLQEFIRARVEAALMYDCDPTALYGMNQKLDQILRVLPHPVQTWEVRPPSEPT